MLLWHREYRLGQPHRISIAAQELHVLNRYRRGEVAQAYGLAVAWERYAVRHGNQPLALRLSAFAHSAGAVRQVPASTALIALEQSAQQAAAMEYWSQAVAYTEEILSRHPTNAGIRGRALANRAAGLHTLGRFDTAVAAYDAYMADHKAWSRLAPNYRIAYAMSREAARWRLGEPVNLPVVGQAIPDLGHAPVTWMAYWWLLGHEAWRKSPERVVDIRQSSIRTFGTDWNMEYDRALWGIDLLAADHDSELEVVERRLRYAIADPSTLRFLGRGSWFDLYSDWLMFLAEKRPGDAAVEIPRSIEWCVEHGYDGWAAYWTKLLSGSPSRKSLSRRKE